MVKTANLLFPLTCLMWSNCIYCIGVSINILYLGIVIVTARGDNIIIQMIVLYLLLYCSKFVLLFSIVNVNNC